MKDREAAPLSPASLHRIPPGSSVLCAVSGGADSVCLLHLLSRREDISLTAAHFNHQLRGEEADRDEAFVRELCQQWHIPLTVGRGDVGAFAKREGLSMEEGARTLRYAFLRQAAQAEGCELIATAHTADDNAETVLLNLIRGSGLKGLGGIPPIQGNIVRPLLDATKKQVVEYLTEHQIPHVEDASNTDETYTRNRLRAQVMPVLRELNPRMAEHMLHTTRRVREVDEALEEEARRFAAGARRTKNQVSLPFQMIEAAPGPLAPRIVLRLLDLLEVGRKDFGAVHLKAVLELKPGGILHLPHNVTARRERGNLILELRTDPLPEAPLLPGKPLSWGRYALTLLELSGLSESPPGDGLTLSLPAGAALTVGPCPPGERLTLPGSKGARTVKRLCLDKGIALAERDGLPALYVDGALAAVWPLGVDAAFAPQNAHGWFIQIKYTEKDEET